MRKLRFLLTLFLLVGCTQQPVDPIVPDEPIVDDVKEDTIVSFMAVGDNLIHAAIYMDAYARHGKYEFNDVYEPVTDFVKSYDVAYINQETILGGTA